MRTDQQFPENLQSGGVNPSGGLRKRAGFDCVQRAFLEACAARSTFKGENALGRQTCHEVCAALSYRWIEWRDRGGGPIGGGLIFRIFVRHRPGDGMGGPVRRRRHRSEWWERSGRRPEWPQHQGRWTNTTDRKGGLAQSQRRRCLPGGGIAGGAVLPAISKDPSSWRGSGFGDNRYRRGPDLALWRWSVGNAETGSDRATVSSPARSLPTCISVSSVITQRDETRCQARPT